MTSEIETAPPFIMKVVERSYSTDSGWRLATVDEAKHNLKMIEWESLWERARLLDGWISGPNDNFQIGDDFRMFLGHMLVTQIQGNSYDVSSSAGNSYDVSRSRYADVALTDRGRDVALHLCAYDWNYEAVYWLLNSWEKGELLNVLNVREGDLPFRNTARFVEMNRMICHLCIILGEEGLAAQKAETIKPSEHSVRQVMVSLGKSCWGKLSQQDQKILPRKEFLKILGGSISDLKGRLSKVNWASQGGTTEVIWNFLWHHISSSTLISIVSASLASLTEKLNSEEDQTRSRRDFIMSTAILYYLLLYEKRAVNRILERDDWQRFEDTPTNNSVGPYDETGNYHVLNNILIHAMRENNSFIVSKVLEWGAQPQASLGPDFIEAFHYCLIWYNRTEIFTSFLDKCDSKEQFANAADEEGMTALHWACRFTDLSIIEMILQYGGKQDIPDKTGRLPLHYAVEYGSKESVSILFDKYDYSKEQLANAEDDGGTTALHLACKYADVSMVETILECGGKPDVVDEEGRLPLHYAIIRGKEDIVDALFERVSVDIVKYLVNIDIVNVETDNMRLLRKSYFDRDPTECLRKFASQGNLQGVEKLLELGVDASACDVRGRTALHYASEVEDEDQACDLTELMLAKFTSEEKKICVGRKDDHDETALHVAAIRGHDRLCQIFFTLNKEILKINDADGRGLLHKVVERSDHDNPEVIYRIHNFWEGGVESIMDHSDLTLLHAAASRGKKFTADALMQIIAAEAKRRYLRQTALHKAAKEGHVDTVTVRYLRTPDILGQTALHKAAKEGHVDTVTVLLHWGAHPLLERDSDGRTALHCAVQNQAEEQTKNAENQTEEAKDKAQKAENRAIAVAELLLKKCVSDEKKLLLLWASAAGLGTADQMLEDSPLKTFLLEQKKAITDKLEKGGNKHNLLRTAACLGDIGMTKELLTRGAQIGDIQDRQWIDKLEPKEKQNVETVLKQIQIIADQGNDQPALSDNLGRSDFAQGLAALLLNPYLKPPITVGISGSWGMGKSSLMIQTEGVLLKTAAQLALLPSETSDASFPGIQILELSDKGKKKYQEIKTAVDLLHKEIKLKKKLSLGFENKKKTDNAKKEDSLSKFLNQYETEYHHIFKSLAAMDSTYMFKPKDQQSQSEIDSPTEKSVPAILTVRYNAWKYRNESEAMAGMAVEITKEMEGIMTDAQWLNTCLRNTLRNQKRAIWFEILFPCILAVILAISFTWIIWLLLDRYKIKELEEVKYASFPLTVVIMVWTLIKKVMSTVHPVSVQLMNYMKRPDHAEKLGYQEQVISDITFLKEEISKRPHFLCTVACNIWRFITGPCIFLLSSKCGGEILTSSTPSANIRTIVFVDDLDRCQESVILQVLAAINLVLAVCQISVVLGMDKELIQRAIMKKYGDKSLKNSRQLADKYLQKIIQLPLDLPEPSEVQSKTFLDRHLGVFQKESREDHSESESDAEDDHIPEIDAAYKALFSPFGSVGERVPDFGEMLGSESPILAEAREPVPGTQRTDTEETRNHVSVDVEKPDKRSDQSLNNIIPIRQMLFMTYSKGEQNVFDYFQKMVTDIRKLPREWKRLLNYHRLVWNIFLINNEAKHLDGWQVQLITWIFICWEWEENINIIIENWDRLRPLDYYEISLRRIVDYFIENVSCITADDKSEKKRDTGKALEDSVTKDTTPEDLEGDKKGNVVSTNKDTTPEDMDEDKKGNAVSTNREDSVTKDTTSEDLEGDKKGKVVSTNKDITPEDMDEDKKGKAVSTKREDPESSGSKLEVSEDETSEVRDPQEDVCNAGFFKGRNEIDALKREMKEHVDSINKQLDRNEKLLAELKLQVDSIVNQRQVLSNEKKKVKSESWRRLKFALQKYNVSMEGIQAFQRFRFYCVAGHLPWPLPPRRITDI